MSDETLAKYPGLYARDNGAFYVRKRVPIDLVGIERRSQLRFSLDTSDLRMAIKRYPFKLAEIEAHFDALRNRLQTMSVLESALSAGKLERLGNRDIEDVVSDWWRKREAARRPTVEHMDEIAPLLSEIEEDAHRFEGTGDSGPVQSVADALLVEAGTIAHPHRAGKIVTQVRYPAVDREAPSYRYLCELVARGLATEAAMAKDYLLSRNDAPHDPIFNPRQKQTSLSPSKDDKKLSDLFLDYTAERSALHGEQSTEKRYGFVFRIMKEVLGSERLVSSLTRADCVEIIAFLKRLPPNATKRFKKLSLREIVEKADADNLRRLSPNSIASYTQALVATLRWAKKAGWKVEVNLNDLVGSREATVKRRGFNSEELNKLFDSISQFRTASASKFWVPALALYTGARAGEICQLRVEDVVNVDGILCLNLSLFDLDGRRVEDKKLKTKASERFVPLHPALIEAGFKDFVETADKARLFPDFKQGPDGRYSHDFSKWFGRHKKKIGLDQPALVFHSFRHGFRDACRRADINDETAQALGGWASEGQAARYGDRSMVPVLNRAMRKLAFDGFILPSNAETRIRTY